jgi:hypothetical protein
VGVKLGLAHRGKNRRGVFENRALREIFGLKGGK